MNQISFVDGKTQPNRRGGLHGGSWVASSDVGLCTGTAICVVVALLLFYGFPYPLHHDLAGGALSGRLAVALGGAFRDYSIYFPPVESVWFSLAARLSELIGLRLDLAVVLMTGTAVLIAASLAYRVRHQTVGASPLFFLGSLAVLVILPILFKNVFGLREHLVALGLWPYLVLRISDPDSTQVGWRLRLLLGFWMGAALLFKYLYCIVVLLVEAGDALMQRRPLLLFRIENIVAGAAVTLYLFCWLVLDPAQGAAIGVMLNSIDAALADTRTNWLQVANNASFAVFFLFAARIFRLPNRAIMLGLALVIGAIIAAWAQERWSTHHVFPVTMAYIAWWWIAARAFRWWGHAVLTAHLLVTIGTQYLSTAPYLNAVEELDVALDGAGLSVAGKRVGILNMHPSPYNQYLASHGAVRWNSMMNNAYVSAELKPFDREENAGISPPPVRLDNPGRRMLHNEMLRLWEDMPPDVLILDHSTRWPLHHIDVEWTHVFSKDPRFNTILKQYRPVLAHKGERLKFTYYIRAD